MANSLTYFTRALLASRVLAVANGGAAVLRGVTPANLGNRDAVEVAESKSDSRRSYRKKNHGQR